MTPQTEVCLDPCHVLGDARAMQMHRVSERLESLGCVIGFIALSCVCWHGVGPHDINSLDSSAG